MTSKFCRIVHTSHQQVLVNGCHPTLSKSYPLASGITAIDLPNGPLLIGQHEVPLTPDSHIMLLSETQARSFGLDIDSKPKQFGGHSSIILEDTVVIPLRLEHALMTCPIRMPTSTELDTLPVNWLTDDAHGTLLLCQNHWIPTSLCL